MKSPKFEEVTSAQCPVTTVERHVLALVTGHWSLALLVVCCLSLTSSVYAEEFVISHFNKRTNELGGNSSVYQQAPSRAMVTLVSEGSVDPGGKALKIDYDKKATGGPYGKGGWCGFYTLLKRGDEYFDASAFKTLHFWVKGAKGDENFKVGLADKQWDQLGDSVKSEDIGKYLPAGKITTDWQQATIPLETFYLDATELASIVIAFEHDCFPGGAGQGTVTIDEMVLK